MPQFLSAAAKSALTKAIKTIESESAAEVVIAVRPRSGSYFHVDLAMAIGLGLATLAFLLYCPWLIAWHYLLGLPILAGTLAALLSFRFAFIRRSLSKRSTMAANVDLAAKSVFVGQGVHHTLDRTGLLIYVSLLERSCSLVADSATELAIPPHTLEQFAQELTAALQQPSQASELATIIEAMAGTFSEHLPAGLDDINELPDGVVS